MGGSQLNRFDRIAPFYDRLASIIFGNCITKAQESNLETIKDCSDVLVLGGGSGKFLSKLLIRNSGCRIWYVEASQKMINQARKHLDFCDRIVFIHGTHQNLPERKFDAIVTHFFVDMFTEQQLSTISLLIYNHLKREGRWLVADFINHKYWHRVILKVMYLFFNLLGVLDLKSLSNWDTIIQSKPFKKTAESTFCKGFIYAAAYVKLQQV